MKTKIYIRILIIVLTTIIGISFDILAQNAAELEWTASYNLNEYGSGIRDMETDRFANIYITGGYGDGYVFDIVTIKLNSAGETLWSKRYINTNGSGTDKIDSNESPYSLAVDPAGNVFVTGYSYPELIIIKYDANGNEIWITRYQDPENKGATGKFIEIDSSGNIYIAGSSEVSNQAETKDILLIKYDSQGNRKWVKYYTGPNNSGIQVANDFQVDKAGNSYLAGYTALTTGREPKMLTMKYNTDGIQEWISFSELRNSSATDLVLDECKNLYVIGYHLSPNSLVDIIKYNRFGQQEWINTLNGYQDEHVPTDIVLDKAKNIYVSGYLKMKNPGNDATVQKYFIFKCDSSGSNLWYRSETNGDSILLSRANTLTLDASGNVYIAGVAYIESKIDSKAMDNFLMIKFNPNGNEQWRTYYHAPSYDGFANCEAYFIALDPGNNVIVSGNNCIILGHYHTTKISTLKFRQVTVQSVPEKPGKEAGLHGIYPNPFIQSTTLKYYVPQRAKVTIEIYNILGELVRVLLNEEKGKGPYISTWNGTNNYGQIVSKGIYIYRVKIGNKKISHKMSYF